jgi:DNA anti-recombination protein RmuC
MNSFDMSWVSLAMAVLQISVVIWKGGELSQRVKHLETDVGALKLDINNVKNDISNVKADINNVKLDFGEFKSEMRADVSFIKGMLSAWQHPQFRNNKLEE